MSQAPTAADDASQQIEVRIGARQVVEPSSRRVVARQGQALEIHWHADEPGELHLHGYDISVRLDPDKPVVTGFVARATGRFAVTSHGFGDRLDAAHDHRALLYLEVHPD